MLLDASAINQTYTVRFRCDAITTDRVFIVGSAVHASRRSTTAAVQLPTGTDYTTVTTSVLSSPTRRAQAAPPLHGVRRNSGKSAATASGFLRGRRAHELWRLCKAFRSARADRCWSGQVAPTRARFGVGGVPFDRFTAAAACF